MNLFNPWKSFGLLLIFFSSSPFYSQAQELPKVLPPSPETAALFKALDYPVDYSTGIADINVPLYEVQSGSLSVPISLSYHGSGRRVSDQNGPVALGWSLNAGGIISRTVYGSPDFGNYPFANPLKTEGHFSEPKTEADFRYLVGIEQYEKAQKYGQGVDTWVDFQNMTSFLIP